MKSISVTLFVIYTIIGLIMAPFIYANNGLRYKPENTSYKIGSAIGNSFFWPSYLFSIEPEVNGKSVESFQASIINILKWRADKLYTGPRNNFDADMVLISIGNCLAANGMNDQDVSNLYSKMFSGNFTITPDLDKIRTKVMKEMDGDDFSEILSDGHECGEKIRRSMAGIASKSH